ncbi:TonB-dependent receptor domain-containing protein [Janthinobacterium agaricidamnosum]|uniref:TonB-dependent Receptor Plug domain protein n=1 Tax=Janthinobacterium agaricidamnosum NBRC 102515 = DSM 9628 TaxID=1349767 RepID=W0VF82_9BURK|nr:TonB-dependent receptor [Janthinobacterium agaricidamnosum]CDG86007.1 tonB-dependent Receptor Plug domain protein [Janthinobacterium agaricidamnosum NBRC 102515 = DSM 9628]
MKNIAFKRSVVAVALTLGSSHVVMAQASPAEPAVHKVFVTGSNIKRAEKEGSSPVQIVGARDIATTGATTVAELLHSIPAFGSGASVDVIDGGFSRGAATASLRGLGSSSTLVLLNGRRIAASAYADPNQGKSAVYDLNAIPLSAIERVEIFKDGASAVYGSDAIAGVINFITKSDYRGLEMSASISANGDNAFGRKNASGIFGFGNLAQDGYNGFISFDVAKRDRTAIKDVKGIEAAMYADINGRLNPYSSSLSNQPFFYREVRPGAFATSLSQGKDIINRSNCDPSQRLVGNAAAHNLTATDPLIGRTFCNYDIDDYAEAQGAGKDANLLSRVTFDLTPNVTAFTEASYSRSERTYTGAPRTFRSTSSSTAYSLSGLPQQFQIILPIGHPDNPFTAANGYAPSRSAVGYRLPGAAGNDNLNQSYRLVAGLKGSSGAFDWETAVLWNRNERTEHYNGLLYKPTLQRIMTENRTLAETAADPGATYNATNQGFSQTTQIDAKASTAFGQLAGGQAGLAFGTELRQEKIGLTPDQATQDGKIVGLANSLADGQRNVSSAFVELRTPFAKNFEMDFAGRYDKYQGMKINFVPKVGAKWTATDKIAVRGTWAEGFRAPALTQISPGGVQSFSTVKDPIRCPDGVNPLPGAEKVDCSGKSISGLSSANPDLTPEKSKSMSLGLILAPATNIDVLIDYYRIKKVDETALLGAQFVIDHADLFPGRVVRDTSPGGFVTDKNGNPIPNSGPLQQVNRTYVNQGSTQVSGVDFEVAMRNSLGEYGKLSTRLNWSYLMEFRRAERPGAVAANTAGYNGGLSDWSTSVGDNPKNRGNISTTWTRGDHALTGSIDYVGPVSLLRRSDNTVTYPVAFCHYGAGQPAGSPSLGGMPKFSNYISNCDVKSWTTLGMNYAYTGIKNLTMSFNIRNVLDTKAPYDPRYPIEGFNSQLHNAQGRYFRVSANYKFM